MKGEERQVVAQMPQWERKERRTRCEDTAGQEGTGGPGYVCGGQRGWLRSAWTTRTARSRAQGFWCQGWGPSLSNSTAPVNSQHTPGTWLGSVVHDPDESFGQQVVVNGLLSHIGHWELDSL